MSKMTQKDLKESRGLYSDIDDCITELLKARTEKDQEAEGKALFRMEGLMVGTLQHLAYLIEREEDKLPEGLEEAARRYAGIDSNHAWWLVNEEEGNDDIMLIRKAFIAGAKWDRAKMLEGAVEADVNTYEDLAAGKSWAEFVVEMPTKNLGDKVKVIVIPEEK